jgi:hypothetical protein
MKHLISAIVLTMLLAGCCGSPPSRSQDNLLQEDSASIEQVCLEAGGTYLAEHNECEDISQEACTAMEGAFDACGSSCRHQPADAVCTAQCVLLCTFDEP